jgi:hypothetical protein
VCRPSIRVLLLKPLENALPQSDPMGEIASSSVVLANALYVRCAVSGNILLRAILALVEVPVGHLRVTIKLGQWLALTALEAGLHVKTCSC